MEYTINSNEAQQLKKQGYSVVAGQMVDVAEMPEWIQERAAANAEPASSSEPRSDEFARPWKGSELKSLARALGADRDPEVREMLNL